MNLTRKALSFSAATLLPLSAPAEDAAILNAGKHTGEKVVKTLADKSHSDNLHVVIESGFELNPFLDNGQILDGVFSSVGAHVHAGHLTVFYHWLQSRESSLEHKAGASYGIDLNDSSTIHIGVNGAYEVGESHEDYPDTSSHHPIEKSKHSSTKHPGSTDSFGQIGVFTDIAFDIHETNNSQTNILVGGEYDFGNYNTGFLHAGIEHILNFDDIQVKVGAKIISVLATNSSHVSTGMTGVIEGGVSLPIGHTDTWTFNAGGQVTDNGDKTIRAGVSLKF